MEEVRVMQEMEVEKNTAALTNDAATLEEFIIQLSWVSHRRLEQELDAFHLTVPQYVALKCIKESTRGSAAGVGAPEGPERSEGCSMSELAESSHQVSATMTGIVDRLLDRGLVVRERDPNDRRTLRVGLTPAGKELLERVQQRKRAWMLQFLETLTPDERRLMIELAKRYLTVLEKSFNAA